MLKFEKPEYKVKEYVKDNFYVKFEIEPLERGFGTTLGNALRRVMLSSLPGDSITSIKIDGVAHEFQKIDGVIEDVTAIVLNIKSLVIKNHSDDYDKVLRLTKSGEGPVTAEDIEKESINHITTDWLKDNEVALFKESIFAGIGVEYVIKNNLKGKLYINYAQSLNNYFSKNAKNSLTGVQEKAAIGTVEVLFGLSF